MPKRKEYQPGESLIIYVRADPELAELLVARAKQAKMSVHQWSEAAIREKVHAPSVDMLARLEQVLSSMEMTQEQIAAAMAALRPSPGSAQGEEGGSNE